MEYERVWRTKREKRNISIISKVKSYFVLSCFKKKKREKSILKIVKLSVKVHSFP